MYQQCNITLYQQEIEYNSLTFSQLSQFIDSLIFAQNFSTV